MYDLYTKEMIFNFNSRFTNFNTEEQSNQFIYNDDSLKTTMTNILIRIILQRISLEGRQILK